MKKKNVLNPFRLPAVLLLSLVWLTASFSTAQTQPPSRKKTARMSRSAKPPGKPGPVVARRVNFCGEPVPVEHTAVAQNLSVALLRNVSYHQYLMRFQRRAVAEYFPVIEKYLYKYQIPQDFKYLAVVESGLRADAVSHKGAVGYWQLMPETARELGLVVSPTVDERKDLVKSTDAACRYLRILHRNLGSWTMVAAAYNGGIGRMQSHMRKQKQSNYYLLSMNQETSDYLYKVVAVKEFFNNPGYANSLDPRLMGELGNPYERERADAIARGLLAVDEPEPMGIPVSGSLELAFESASVDSLLGSLTPTRAVAAKLPTFRGDVEAVLIKAGKPVIGQTWQFRIASDAEIGDQRLSRNDLLYATVDDVDTRRGQIFLRATKLVSEIDQKPYKLTLICLNPRTGLAGVAIPKADQMKQGWTVGWKAM